MPTTKDFIGPIRASFLSLTPTCTVLFFFLPVPGLLGLAMLDLAIP